MVIMQALGTLLREDKRRASALGAPQLRGVACCPNPYLPGQLSSGLPSKGRTGSGLQMNRLNLRSYRLKLKTAGKFPTISEEFIENYTQFSKGKTEDVNM